MKSAFMILAFVLALAPAAYAQVPRTINLQTLVYDQDGNLTGEEFVNVGIEIADANGGVLFSEDHNNVPVVEGAISLHIGETVGGIPSASLDPSTGRKFVNVLVNETRPYDLLPLDAVPYSIWADKALGVVDNSIGGTQIKNGSIETRHLAKNVGFSEIDGTVSESQIPSTIARSQNLDKHVQSSSAHKASAIAVDSSGAFAAQLGSNLQVALDRIFKRVGEEIANRQLAVQNIGTQITTMQTSLQNQIATAQTNLQSQITSNDNDITSLNSSVSSLSGRVSTAESNISSLSGRVSTNENSISTINGEITSIKKEIDEETTPTPERVFAWGYTKGGTDGSRIFGNNYSSSVVNNPLSTDPDYSISFSTAASDDNVAVIATLTTPSSSTNTIKYVRIGNTSKNGFTAKCYLIGQQASMAISGEVTTCDDFYWVALGN